MVVGQTNSSPLPADGRWMGSNVVRGEGPGVREQRQTSDAPSSGLLAQFCSARIVRNLKLDGLVAAPSLKDAHSKAQGAALGFRSQGPPRPEGPPLDGESCPYRARLIVLRKPRVRSLRSRPWAVEFNAVGVKKTFTADLVLFVQLCRMQSSLGKDHFRNAKANNSAPFRRNLSTTG